MIDMLQRHEIQVLRRADHTWTEIAALSGVSEKTARRIAERVVSHVPCEPVPAGVLNLRPRVRCFMGC